MVIVGFFCFLWPSSMDSMTGTISLISVLLSLAQDLDHTGCLLVVLLKERKNELFTKLFVKCKSYQEQMTFMAQNDLLYI